MTFRYVSLLEDEIFSSTAVGCTATAALGTTVNNCHFRFCLLLQSNCNRTAPFFSTHFIGWL